MLRSREERLHYAPNQNLDEPLKRHRYDLCDCCELVTVIYPTDQVLLLIILIKEHEKCNFVFMLHRFLFPCWLVGFKILKGH